MTRPQRPSDRLHELVALVSDGRADRAAFVELEDLLREDADARRYYIESMELLAALRRSRSPSSVEPGQSGHDGPRPTVERVRSRLAWAVAAAVLLIAALVRTWLGWGALREAPVAAVAVVDAAEGVAWLGPAPGPRGIGAELHVGQSLGLERGTLGLRFGRDALVTLQGPAELELLSAVRVRAVRGKVTVRVGSDSRGFTVETPRAEVVDLGTEFGLQIDDAGGTDVVVFQGAIDLSYGVRKGDKSARPPTRLTQGEALRLGSGGDMSRIVSVERRSGDVHWSTDESTGGDVVIQRVGDDIRGLGSTKYYQIVPHGLVEDAPAYVDRPHQWNGLDAGGLPGFLRGADYVMPFNVDKRSREIQVTVTLARPATLYVFFDDRAEVPRWLAEQFTDTGWDIGLDEGRSPEKDLTTEDGPGRSIDTVFSVWKCEVNAAGRVTLGAMVDVRSDKAMYGIAAQARPRPTREQR